MELGRGKKACRSVGLLCPVGGGAGAGDGDAGVCTTLRRGNGAFSALCPRGREYENRLSRALDQKCLPKEGPLHDKAARSRCAPGADAPSLWLRMLDARAGEGAGVAASG